MKFRLAFGILTCILTPSLSAKEIIRIKCGGLTSYTGLIGTDGHFTSTDFLKDAEYKFNTASEEINIIYADESTSFCGNYNCNVTFDDRYITAIREEPSGKRIYQTALAYDRKTLTLRLVKGGPGSLIENYLYCSEIAPN